MLIDHLFGLPSGHSSWLQIQRSGVHSQRYQTFWVVVVLEQGNGSGLENRDYGCMGIRRADYATSLYPQKLALTSPTSGGRSVGIIR
jgi:hypothetical protein